MFFNIGLSFKMFDSVHIMANILILNVLKIVIFLRDFRVECNELH